LVLLKGQSNGSQSTCVPFRKHDRWTPSCPVSAHLGVERFLRLCGTGIFK